jgi:glycosyltransferase involved in cell wall biosynthesis
VTEEAGRLVPLGDAAALQQAMADMVSSYGRWQASEPSIRSYVESSFGEAAIGSRLIETYNSVIRQA